MKSYRSLNEVRHHLNKDEIGWLNKNIENWNIKSLPNNKYEINVNGNVDFASTGNVNIKEISFNFGAVTGYFSVRGCRYLNSLKGCPHTVGNYFSCARTDIKNLIGGPRIVNGNYYVYECFELESLDGVASSISDNLYIHTCEKLKNIDGIQKLEYSCLQNDIFVDCDSLPKNQYDLINNKELFMIWKNSKLKLEEFLDKYHGSVSAINYGI